MPKSFYEENPLTSISLAKLSVPTILPLLIPEANAPWLHLLEKATSKK